MMSVIFGHDYVKLKLATSYMSSSDLCRNPLGVLVKMSESESECSDLSRLWYQRHVNNVNKHAITTISMTIVYVWAKEY